MKKGTRNLCSAAVVGALVSFGMSAAEAAGADCKGLSQTVCEDSAACTWVSGYTTKKGVEVGPYCRVKSAKTPSVGKADKSSAAQDKS